jgi:prevent-host-death family protein
MDRQDAEEHCQRRQGLEEPASEVDAEERSPMRGQCDLMRPQWVMKRVAISELKSHLSEHIRAAEGGEVIEVMDRARPVARVVPIEGDASLLELLPAESSFASVRDVRLPRAVSSMSSLKALRRDRGER